MCKINCSFYLYFYVNSNYIIAIILIVFQCSFLLVGAAVVFRLVGAVPVLCYSGFKPSGGDLKYKYFNFYFGFTKINDIIRIDKIAQRRLQMSTG